MKITLRIVVYLLFLSSVISYAQIDATSINTLFYDYTDESNPGAIVTIVKNNKLLLTKAYGSANLEYNIPLTTKTPINVASLTKQFVCFAILLLQEEGKLYINDDIKKFIPELQTFQSVITINHLMSHTSGLNDQWHLLSLAGWKLDDVITHQMILDLLYKQHTLSFLPGEEYVYSNSNYTLLAEIITRVSNTSFSKFIHDKILDPLEMKDSFVDDDFRKIVKNKAYSYQKTPDGFKKSIFSTDTYGPRGIITTAEDIAKWMSNFHKIKIGSNKIVDVLDTPQKLNNGSFFGAAYGQFHSNYNGSAIIHHTGSEAAYRSYLVRFPKEKLSIAVLSNRNDMNPKKLALQVADQFLKSTSEKPLEYVINNKPQTIKPYYLAQNKLRFFEGKYWDFEKNNSKIVKLSNDTLWYMLNKEMKTPLIPIDERKFMMYGLPNYNEVTFRTTDDSSIKLDITSNGSTDTLYGYTDSHYTNNEFESFTGVYFSEELNTILNVCIHEGTLIISHQRQEDIILEAVMDDFFISNCWYIKNVRFIRKNKEISGLEISSNRMRNVRFKKIELD